MIEYLANGCQDIYASQLTDWDKVWTHDSVIIGKRTLNGNTVLTLRGSKLAIDWYRDFKVWPVKDRYLGYCHAGFVEDMWQVFQEIIPYLAGKCYITGHSLGGARACILAGYLITHGYKIERLSVFGCPRPGFSKLIKLLRENIENLDSYRNCDDEVPEVPQLLGLYKEPLNPPTPLNACGSGDGPLKDHHIALYIAGLKKAGIT